MKALIKPIKGVLPNIHSSCFIAENSTIIGQVKIAEHSSIWYGCIIRGDVNQVSIGANTNVQDATVIHCTYQKHATTIGNQVSIGHKAIIHGCSIEDLVLIGMGAIIMDGANIGEGSIIAAGSVVKENTQVPPWSLYAGNPAVFKKKLDPKKTRNMIENLAKNYTLYGKWQN